MAATDAQDATYQIWVELKSNLHGFIARRTNNEADAEDILQNVFFKIHTNIGHLRETTKLHSWVYQITRNAIIDYYRTRKADVSFDASPEAFDMTEEEPAEGDAEREEIMACLRPMVDRLPADYQKALVMADIHGVTQAKVADALNISLSGAKSRVQRARGRMKDMLFNCCHFEFDRLGRAVAMNSRDCGSACAAEKCDS